MVRPEESEPLPQLVSAPEPHRVHLVVVTTRPADETAPAAAPMLIARYWQPRQMEWVEHPVESVEHALRLFVGEHGWVLRQQQVLDSPDRHELIFETRIDRLGRPSAAQVLEAEVGLSPKDVEELIQRVEERVEGSDGAR